MGNFCIIKPFLQNKSLQTNSWYLKTNGACLDGVQILQVLLRQLEVCEIVSESEALTLTRWNWNNAIYVLSSSKRNL